MGGAEYVKQRHLLEEENGRRTVKETAEENDKRKRQRKSDRSLRAGRAGVYTTAEAAKCGPLSCSFCEVDVAHRTQVASRHAVVGDTDWWFRLLGRYPDPSKDSFKA